MSETRPREPAVRAVHDYAARYPDFQVATADYIELVTALLDDAGINYLSVTGRTKTVGSYAEKALREVDGQPMFVDPASEITDAIGIRVITYLFDDVDAVAEILAEHCVVLDDRDMGRETADEGQWGYASRHLLIAIRPDQEGEAALEGFQASVQVRTVLQHAWAEFEHDIRYKGKVPAIQAPDLNRRFTLAAGLLELADREFTAIRDQIQATMRDGATTSEGAGARIGTPELTAYLASRYVGAAWSRTDHYTWIAEMLAELGVRTIADLAAVLETVDEGALQERSGYRHPARAVRRLDDALLSVFGERYVELPANSHRTDRLRSRAARLRG